MSWNSISRQKVLIPIFTTLEWIRRGMCRAISARQSVPAVSCRRPTRAAPGSSPHCMRFYTGPEYLSLLAKNSKRKVKTFTLPNFLDLSKRRLAYSFFSILCIRNEEFLLKPLQYFLSKQSNSVSDPNSLKRNQKSPDTARTRPIAILSAFGWCSYSFPVWIVKIMSAEIYTISTTKQKWKNGLTSIFLFCFVLYGMIWIKT